MLGGPYDPTRPPVPVAGLGDARVQIAEVVAVNGDNTLDARPITRRALKAHIPYPTAWVPQIGERCLIANRDGDPRQPICLGHFAPKNGSLAGPVTRSGNSKPTVTGSRGGNAALTSLLSGLAGAGLIVDNTTA